MYCGDTIKEHVIIVAQMGWAVNEKGPVRRNGAERG